jgi:hypothetical protein
VPISPAQAEEILKIVLRFSVATGTASSLFSTSLSRREKDMPTHPRIRRAVAGAAMAAVVAAGVAVGTSEAAGSGSSPPPPVKSTAGPASPVNVRASVRAALDRLVAAGTITAAQASTVQRQVDSGSVDPKQLVDAGVLNDVQMHAVQAAITQVKMAAGGG